MTTPGASSADTTLAPTSDTTPIATSAEVTTPEQTTEMTTPGASSADTTLAATSDTTPAASSLETTVVPTQPLTGTSVYFSRI